MKKATKKDIVHYVLMAVLVVVILFLLFFKGCDKNVGGGSTLISGGGSSPSGSTPVCREGYSYYADRCECLPDPCISGYTGVLEASYHSCVRNPNPGTTVRDCSSVSNPLSQRDCDAVVCSVRNSPCIYHPASSMTSYSPSYCGCD